MSNMTRVEAKLLVLELVTAVEEDDEYMKEQATERLIDHLSGEHHRAQLALMAKEQEQVALRLEALKAAFPVTAPEQTIAQAGSYGGSIALDGDSCDCNAPNPFHCHRADIDEPCVCGCHGGGSDEESTLSGDIFS